MGGWQKGKSPQKFKTDSGITVAWKRFLKNYCTIKVDGRKKRVNNKYNLTQNQYSSIIELIHNKIIEEIIYKNFDYQMPCGLGKIRIAKYRPKVHFFEGRVVNRNMIDWNTTMKMWRDNPETKVKGKFYRYENSHSNDWLYRIQYLRTPGAIQNMYDFYPTREFGLELTKRIMSDPEMDAPLCTFIKYR